MPPPELWAGTLNAARLLDRLSESPELDDATRGLCERASNRLHLSQPWETQHAGTA